MWVLHCITAYVVFFGKFIPIYGVNKKKSRKTKKPQPADVASGYNFIYDNILYLKKKKTK